MRLNLAVVGSICALTLASCSSLTIEHVTYGWPVEVVETVNPANMVVADRYGLTLSLSKIAENEFQDSSALKGTQIRLLRNTEGCYFITGPRFKNVYVFHPDNSRLVKESIIAVSESGLKNPAFNLRPPYVELVDNGIRKLLSSSDIVEEKTP